jgi:hypothetical protein
VLADWTFPELLADCHWGCVNREMGSREENTAEDWLDWEGAGVKKVGLLQMDALSWTGIAAFFSELTRFREGSSDWSKPELGVLENGLN